MAVNEGDIVRADHRMLYQGTNELFNIYQLRLADGGPISDADALDDLEAIFTALIALVRLMQASGIVHDIVRFVNRTLNQDIGISIANVGVAGSIGQNTQPLQVAYGLTLNTTLLSVRGRKFIPGTTITGVPAGGTVSAGTIALLADVGDYLTDQHVVNGRTWEFGVTSVSTGIFRYFDSYGVSSTAVTQRRRRIGVGS